MSLLLDFRVLELLCSRLCHELVSPVGAINNGVELLGEDDPEFVKDAIALIGQSGRKAGQRLQFYRLAYGAAVGAQSTGSAPNGRELVQGLLEGGKVRCEWPAEAASLPLNWQKLACNMVVLAAEALPRGGAVSLKVLGPGPSGVAVTAEGEGINVTPEARAAIAEGATAEDLTSRTVHAYFTARLATVIGARLEISPVEGGRAVFTAAAVGTP